MQGAAEQSAVDSIGDIRRGFKGSPGRTDSGPGEEVGPAGLACLACSMLQRSMPSCQSPIRITYFELQCKTRLVQVQSTAGQVLSGAWQQVCSDGLWRRRSTEACPQKT